MKTKRTKTIIAAALMASLLHTTAFASLPGEGIVGQDGSILSDVRTLAGTGEFLDANGDAAAASFRSPEGVVVAPDGTIYVSDTANHVIRRIKDGQVSTYAGLTLTLAEDGTLPEGTLLDGPAGQALFNRPAGLALDAQGNLYVADSGNHAIRKVAPDGTVTTIAGDGVLGSEDGQGSEAGLYSPQDVAVAADGTIYVADTLNHLIRTIDATGNVDTLNEAALRPVEVQPGNLVAAGDYRDGALSQALFNEPSSLAFDENGNLYVSDAGNQVIRYIDLAAQTVTTVAGATPTPTYAPNELYAPAGYADGPALQAQFNFPKGIVYTEEDGLVIADQLNHVIRYLKDGIVSTLAGDETPDYGNADGINGTNAFHAPSDVALTSDDLIVIADAYNNKIRVFETFALPAGIQADGSIHVVFDGEPIKFDAQPEIKQDRTMIPMRAVIEAFGFEVGYENGVVTARTGGKTITLQPGSTSVEIREGERTVTRTIDAPPYIQQDRVYLPLRFFSGELGLDVQWDQATRTAILRTK